jgi:hypothetical protein
VARRIGSETLASRAANPDQLTQGRCPVVDPLNREPLVKGSWVVVFPDGQAAA